MSANLAKKRHEPCVFFLDDGLDADTLFDKLRAAGFEVKRFRDKFRDVKGNKLEGIKDPDIIKHCADTQQVLLTSDKHIVHQLGPVIAKTDISIIATESNQSRLDIWAEALKNAQKSVERHVKNFSRPAFACISKSGKLRRKIHVTEDWLKRNIKK